ncbi:MAG TPA: valine--tRNA ligase [Acidimicrobiales bacterium]|nr:valine--tRNA ligase [Acidimicrobiales bacterium]
MNDALSPRAPRVPDKPTVDGLEATWIERWDSEGTYRFDADVTREDVYSIDTPPPTVSGNLHIGHVFSYTHTDIVARYWRMRGKHVFYPMGWDDNGLATERRVENYFGVRGDADLAYDPDFEPPATPGKEKVSISRKNFVELCRRLTVIDEEAFRHVFRTLGASIDWSMEYTTVGAYSQEISQHGFLEMLARGNAYSTVAPTLWDVDFRTAVSQAELEDRERPGHTHRVSFHRPDGGVVQIDTTRPEMLPSCVALVAHPDDARYADLVGTTVESPLFHVSVPVVAHELADPDKGTGIAMICTFGDVTDVTWWRELRLPTRALVGRDGRFLPATFGEGDYPSLDATAANALYAQLTGRTVNQVRATVVDALRTSGDLIGEPTAVTHPVKFYEKGERPLEIVTSRQWFVETLAHRAELLARGEELHWHPDYMRHRYRSWVEGLNVDWSISRQRFFGVPFPVWYRIDEAGVTDFDSPLLASLESLPVDPSTDVPPGYDESQRHQPGGFTGEPDVMDTWATSSLTPEIAGHRGTDLFAKVFPMDLRPQAHDIIRTWLFSTVVRSEFTHDALPWRHTVISGFILDPDRKKMSKSTGNVVTPLPLLENHGADAVRYWAACGRPGADTALDEAQMKVGRRLAIKVLNASKFVLGRLEGVAVPSVEAVTEPLDRDFLAVLAGVVTDATVAFDAYDHTRALERTEAAFWSFCDDYLELVKIRSYADAADPATLSALATLALTLSIFQRLLAPVLPFATEEAWRWWHEGSVHRAPWPRVEELGDVAAPSTVYRPVCDVLEAVRRAKSSAKASQRAEVARCVIHAPAAVRDAVSVAARDLCAAGVIVDLAFEDAGELRVEVTLAG